MIDERYLPRVWTKGEYYYPYFSELGITYENPNKEFSEENIETLSWAFGWHFGTTLTDEKYKLWYKDKACDDGIYFDHTLEHCTTKKDTNSILIYENDVVMDEWGNKGIVFYSNHFLRWQIRWYEGRTDLIENEYGVSMFDWTYPNTHLTIISNVHILSDEIKNITIIKG